jgi:hypothetical protein
MGKRLLFAIELLCMVGGLALAIAAAGRQVGGWRVLGWVISTVAAVHLLTGRRTGSNDFRVGRPDPVLRVFVASVAIFCFTILVIITTILLKGQLGPMGQADAVVFSVLGLIGLGSAALSIRWIWK